MEFTLKKVKPLAGEMTVVLCGDPGAPDNGARLEVASAKDEAALQFRLVGDGKELAVRKVDVSADEAQVAFMRRGKFLIVTVDGKRVITVTWEPSGDKIVKEDKAGGQG